MSGGSIGQCADKLCIAIYPPTVYYSRVGLELAKLVFKGRQMSPP
jgi:(2Fe-2S) ferredoxin